MKDDLFTTLARYKTPGKSDVVFGTVSDMDTFENTRYLQGNVVYVTPTVTRCPNVRCGTCPLDNRFVECTSVKALSVFPQFCIYYPEHLI